tara:strand:+ start:670 stop:1299 length:630 start_codon:yes stop_codon:yes gene_type:complete
MSILYSLMMSQNEFHSQVFFMACKAWIFILPTYWYLRVEGNSLSKSLPDRDGLVMGSVTGVSMAIIILAVWLLLGHSIDSSMMISKLEETGLTDVRLYVAGTIYWIFLNSLLEEYVFRWFITTKSIDLLGSESGAIALSAVMFTLHHTMALHLFGFEWWQTVIASFGLLSAAAIWSWLYIRHRSIWVCWLSHAICDVAVFGIGYLIIFS